MTSFYILSNSKEREREYKQLAGGGVVKHLTTGELMIWILV